jgi:AcrR family transcriptional regulator
MPTEERRAQITQAAMKIIGEKGLRAFTIVNVAKEVGIKDGTVFRHFKNKKEIVCAVLDALEKIFDGTIPSSTAGPLERLGEFFLNRIKGISDHPGIQSIIFSDQLSHAGGEIVFKRVTQQRKKAQKYIQSCLVEASQQGLIRQEIDLDDILVLFHGVIMSLVFLSKNHSLSGSMEERSVHVLKTFMSMIRR